MMSSIDDFNVNVISDDEEVSEKLRLVGEKRHPVVRVSSRRWVILALASVIALVNGIQNLQFAGSEVQIIYFFGVTEVLGDLLTQAYYISFVVFAFPVIWLVKKFGLRFTAVIASLLNFLSASMTAVSITQNHLFYLALVSEFIAGISQILVLCIPSLLAGIWFPTNELSTASGTVIFFYQYYETLLELGFRNKLMTYADELGNGLALLVPPLVIPIRDSAVSLGDGATIMFSVLAGIGFVSFVVTLIFFKEKPDYPPKLDQGYAESSNSSSFTQSIQNLLSNGNFVLLFFSYGIDCGILSAGTSLLKPVIADRFEFVSDATTGQIVAFLVVIGTSSAILFGLVLDKTKKFFWTLIVIHFISILSTVLFIVAMATKTLWLVWVGSAIFGLGFTGKMSAGIETAAEITYPEPESTSSGLLMWSTSVFTTFFIQIMRILLTINNVYVAVFLSACAVVAGFLTCFMKDDLRRLKASYEGTKLLDDVE